VLQSSVPRQAGSLNFFVPSPVHEAITSLLASLLVGGWLKEKYFPKVRQMFASDSSEVIAALSPQFGLKAATRLVDSVIDGDRRKILGRIRSLRVSLGLRSLLHRPLRSALAIARHYARVIVFRNSPKMMETVCILGPNGCGKTRLIEGLMPILQSASKVVEKRQPKLKISFTRVSSEADGSTYSRAEVLRGSLASAATVVQLLLEEWLNQFTGKKNLTLRIFERYYHDLLIDPKMYDYNGPMWFAGLVGKLFPSPDLWILLDAPAKVMQSRNQQHAPAETLRQLEAYRAFVKTRKKYIILDASKPADSVIEDAYAAIIDMLAQRTDRQLKNRF
jgi:thymidylate kinase